MAMRPNWSKEACVECGNEGLASRGEEHVDQGPYTCSDCDLYKKAFNAGYEARRRDEVMEVKQAKEKALAERTAMQVESNRLLFERRAKKEREDNE